LFTSACLASERLWWAWQIRYTSLTSISYRSTHVSRSSLWRQCGKQALTSTIARLLWHWGLAWCWTPFSAAVHQAIKSLKYEVLNCWQAPPIWHVCNGPGWCLQTTPALSHLHSWLWWVRPVKLQP
jgi:hypothetical protein